MQLEKFIVASVSMYRISNPPPPLIKSFPDLTTILSAPSPPLIVSLPPPAKSRSSPPPPFKVLFASFPDRISLPLSALIVADTSPSISRISFAVVPENVPPLPHIKVDPSDKVLVDVVPEVIGSQNGDSRN